MPKRGYPFTETFSSQYKIHIRQHELSNSSVLGNKYRKEIYGSGLFGSSAVGPFEFRLRGQTLVGKEQQTVGSSHTQRQRYMEEKDKSTFYNHDVRPDVGFPLVGSSRFPSNARRGSLRSLVLLGCWLAGCCVCQRAG
ncbi:apoptosis regulatory protein Siva isoform X2 [Syngnathus acus]|uniref:apoptosis regulatory protein Siva isoform X2 n=1 Tax=Syngnathus acus TaxID=161584 RepID=UPI001885BA2C|nr:apoptosis regulatory protein Siva isoform X2 [Syngnathus acus]